MTLRTLIIGCQHATDPPQIIGFLKEIDAECKKIKSNYGKRGPVSRKLDEIREIALVLKGRLNGVMKRRLLGLRRTSFMFRGRPPNIREVMKSKEANCKEMLVLDDEIGAILKKEFTEAES